MCSNLSTVIKGRGVRKTSIGALQLFGTVYHTECNCATVYYLAFNDMSSGQISGESVGNWCEPIPRYR